MNTKGILFAILALGSITLINAQQPAGYFFKEFTPGKVLLKNKQFAKGKFNYDCINKEMHFLNESTDMVIENLEDIDTVVIDIHRFIPFEGHFMEVMTDQHTTLFIDWKVKPKDIGKKGAMGTVTHGSVQAIDVKLRSFRNIHSLLKLYSKDKQQLIKEFIETEKIKIENPKDILKVLKRFQ